MIARPAFPEPLRYLWNWFKEIQGGVQGNGTTYPVITWEALHCWMRLTREELSPRDARMIVALSNIWVGIMAEKVKDQIKNAAQY